MEVLSATLSHVLQSNADFSYHWHTKEIKLSHLIFSDDIFLFCRDTSSINAVLTAVDQSSTSSGLRINKDKSLCLFGNVPTTVIQEIISTSGHPTRTSSY